ncbi:hypothetical protein [Luteibacter yeojuensis]|uniref:hypothetical protein n=1 Tax=Luteibacter yeojuensis TaxID=345309 RepID=UPI0012EDC12B|nr:hypothetical protein [Luteibacter yeojuensis]
MTAWKAYIILTSSMFAVSFSIVGVGGLLATLLYGGDFDAENMLFLLKQASIAGAGTGGTCFAIAAFLPRLRSRR